MCGGCSISCDDLCLCFVCVVRQIFLGTTYQNGEKYTKTGKTIPKWGKYTKTGKNIPKLEKSTK
jgi:hypothetical protein